MANGVITWNGVASDTLGIIVSKVPSLNRPQRKYNSYSASGRNGDIVIMQDAYAEYEQEYEIFALDGAQVDARAIVDWLYQDGWCELSDDWEPDYYRMAYFVGPVDIEPIMDEAAVCTITFRCKPQRYLIQDPITVASGTTLNNPTNHIALPIFTLTGTGIHSMFDLTRAEMTGTDQYASSWLYNSIFSEYFGWGNYRIQDGYPVVSFFPQSYAASSGGSITSKDNSTGTLNFRTWRAASNTPYYGVGTAFDVSANADYTISCISGYSCKIVVVFFSGSGLQQIIGTAEESRSGSGKLSLTFHTPTECGHVLIFFHPITGATVELSNIMFVQGAEEMDFKAYTGSTPYILTLGDTSLQFTVNGFDTAIVDCERENISINGVDSNYNSTVLDKYGNISAEYIKFKPGDSVLTYSSDITSVTAELRTWEL